MYKGAECKQTREILINRGVVAQYHVCGVVITATRPGPRTYYHGYSSGCSSNGSQSFRRIGRCGSGYLLHLHAVQDVQPD